MAEQTAKKTIKDFYGPITGIFSLLFAAGMTYATIKQKADKDELIPKAEKTEVEKKADKLDLEISNKKIEELQKFAASVSEIVKQNANSNSKISEDVKEINNNISDIKKDIAVQNQINKQIESKVDKLTK